MIIGLNGYAGSGKDTVGKMIQYLTSNVVGDFDPNGEYWTDSDWQIKKFAYKLKQIASIITGIPIEKFEDQDFKKTYMSPEWNTYGIIRGTGNRQQDIQAFPHLPSSLWFRNPENYQVENIMTVREFLQKLGMEGLRDNLHPNVWLNALFAEYVEDSGFKYQVKVNKVVEDGMQVEVLSPEPERFNNGYPNWIITDCRFPNEAQAIKDRGGIVIRIDRPGFTPVNLHPSETSLDDWDFNYKIANVSDLVSLQFTVERILKLAQVL